MLVVGLLIAILFVLIWLSIMLQTMLSNQCYLINLIEYGDKKNGRGPILPEAKEGAPKP